MGAIGRASSVVSDSSAFRCSHCPVLSDSFGGVGLVCGMKRGISDEAMLRSDVLIGTLPWSPKIGTRRPMFASVRKVMPNGDGMTESTIRLLDRELWVLLHARNS